MNNKDRAQYSNSEVIDIRDEKFRAAAENSKDALMLLDPVRDENGIIYDFSLAYINKAAQQQTGIQGIDWQERTLSEEHPALLNESFIEACSNVLSLGIPQTITINTGKAARGRRANKTEASLSRFNNGLALSWHLHPVRSASKGKEETGERLFSSIFRFCPDAIIISRLSDGAIVRVNRKTEQLFGYREDEMAGRTSAALGLFADIEEREKALRQLKEQGSLKDYSVDILTSKGEKRQVSFASELVELEGEKCILTSIRDITGRVLAEEQVKQSEERFRSTLDNMIEGCAIVGFDWEYIYLNQVHASHARLDKDEMLGKRMYDLVPEVKGSIFYDAYKTCLEQRISQRVDLPFTFADGNVTWFTVIANPVPEGMFVMSVDVTNRKRAEEELRKNESILKLILDHINEGIIVSDAPYGKVAAVSRWGLNQTLGRSVDAVVNLPIEKYLEQWDVRDIYSGRKVAPEGLPVARALKGEVIEGEEWMMVRPDGSSLFVAVNAVPIHNSDKTEIMTAVATWTDITERKNTLEALKQSEEKFNKAFHASPVPMTIADLWDRKWVDVNDSFLEMTGYSRDEIVGRNSGELDIIVEDTPGQRDKIVSALVTDGTVSNVEISARTKSGGLLDLLLSGVIVDLGGKKYAISLHVDITQRKKAEKELIKSKNQYELIFNSIAEGFAHYKAVYGPNKVINDLLVLEINPAGASLMGIPREEQIGKSWRTLWPNIEDYLFDIFREVDVSGEPFTFEHISPITGKWYSTTISLSAEGQFAVTFFDITERKSIEESLRRSEEGYHQLADSMPQIVWTLNDIGEITYYNKKWYEFTGMPEAVPVNPEKWLIVHPDEVQEAAELWNESFQKGLLFEKTLRKRAKDGQYYWHIDRVVPLKDKEGNIIRWIGTATNIHELTMARKNLEKTLKELEHSNKDLEDFAFAASHDLQEPVRMVGSYAQLLMKNYHGKFDPRADKYIRFLFEGSVRLQVLIRDLMHYSRLRNQQMVYAWVDPDDIIQGIAADRNEEIRKTGTVIKHYGLPRILGDPEQIRELFRNLIDNSIKYKKDGVPPVIDISCEERKKEWLFKVSDNGIGIDGNYHHLIFTVLKRLNDREKFPGVGIGLAICKRIIERHEGRIWVESEPDRGTTIYFTIPKEFEKR